MSSSSKTLQKPPAPECFNPFALYAALRRHFGPSGWWPGESPLEVAVGAVLTQNTAWSNVEKAIDNLKAGGMLDAHRIHLADTGMLASLIRPSGYYNLKAARLKNLIRVILDISSGDADSFFNSPPDHLREVLLGINGIGKETADSICCYAANVPVFVVDAYTKRILSRHGVIDAAAGYDEVRMLFEQGLPQDLSVYKDLHAYLVFIGKDYCRPRNPLCSECPLQNLLGPS